MKRKISLSIRFRQLLFGELSVFPLIVGNSENFWFPPNKQFVLSSEIYQDSGCAWVKLI